MLSQLKYVLTDNKKTSSLSSSTFSTLKFILSAMGIVDEIKIQEQSILFYNYNLARTQTSRMLHIYNLKKLLV